MELKRGFFFSLISMLLLLGLFYLAQPRAYESSLVQEQASQERIVFTNAIIQSFENGYLARAVESQSALVLDALGQYLHEENGAALLNSRDELEDLFTEGLVTGTFNTEPVENYLPASYSDASRDLVELLELFANASGQSYNIEFVFSEDPADYEIELFQDDGTGPWQVGVELVIPYNVSPNMVVGESPIANWTREAEIEVYANIREVRDPFLYVRSDGNITSPIREFYTERWSSAVFESFAESGRYYPYADSMSLLGRYYESHEYSDCCGILTTINRTRYQQYYPTFYIEDDRYQNITFLDCGYFPTSPVTAACRQGGDSLVFAVVGYSSYQYNSSAGAITCSVSPEPFPFTLPGRLASELFNMTQGVDLYDTYTAITDSTC